jgi:cell division protein ZapA (FtsZ GTPase activity inhibitor)
MNGMEMLFKSMGFNPQDILKQAQGIGQAFQNIAGKLDTIEANQKLIMVALNIPVEMTPELLAIADERSAEFREPERKIANG